MKRYSCVEEGCPGRGPFASPKWMCTQSVREPRLAGAGRLTQSEVKGEAEARSLWPCRPT